MGTSSYSADEAPGQDSVKDEAPAQTFTPPQESTPASATPAKGIIDVLEDKVAALEAKLKSVEEEAIKSVHDRVTSIEELLKRKHLS